MHYSSAQHLADFAIDPVGLSGDSYSNPFKNENTYAAGQWYMAPVSLGAIPSSTNSGCQIDPFEEDNLLDATQRHTSMDWNTVVQGSENGQPPSAHIVDTPSHQNAGGTGANGENMAGEIVARSYLLTSATTYTNPYAILRDVSTGCAYYNPATYAENAALLNIASLSTLHCKTYPTTEGCQAVASTKDLSCPNGAGDNPNCGITNWLDPVQQDLHSSDTEVIPQGCYANGSGGANAVAWVRGPEWTGTPNPDDAYIGARISATHLAYAAAENRVIQMQFQLPVMPTIPQSGYLTGSEQLRYYSLTFIQEQETDGPSIVADIDGVDTHGIYPTKTLASLADPAFCTSSNCAQSSCTSATETCYVTLILGVGGGSLSGIEGSSANCTAGTYAPFGFGPSAACVPWNNGYTVLDLTQSGLGATLSTTQDLQIVMRNTLPSSSFSSAGQWVPFYTAEYTGENAGLMGPYAPVVTYPTISSLNGTTAPTSPTLESTASLPTTPPVLTTVSASLSLTGNTVQWPTFWPGTASPASQNLVCPAAGISPNQPTTPTINFAASLVSSEVSSTCMTDAVGTCNSIQALYTEKDAFTTATAPPTLVTIVGSGFGYYGQTLPFAAQNPSYLQINDDGHSTDGATAWNTAGTTELPIAECKVYVANWSDTSISLVINAPINAYNLYLGTGDPLSPLSDFSPLTLFPNAYNTQVCPVGAGDTLTFYVTNPEYTGSGTNSMAVCVGTSGVAPTPCPT
jgi:hypothetical protein